MSEDKNKDGFDPSTLDPREREFYDRIEQQERDELRAKQKRIIIVASVFCWSLVLITFVIFYFF